MDEHRPTGKVWPRAILIVGLAGFVTIAGVLATATLPAPTPSAPVAAATLGSATADVPTDGPSPSRLVIPTSPPTPPAWQMVRTAFDDRIALADEGAWGLNNRVLSLVYRTGAGGLSWRVARFTATAGMEVFQPPAQIAEFRGGSVIDNRLWFFVRIGPQDSDEGDWRLFGTANGEAWKRLGVAEGLAGTHPAAFVGRVGGNWVSAVWPAGSSGSGAPTRETLFWAADGVHWKRSAFPEGPGIVSFEGVGMLGESIVLLVQRWTDFEDVAYSIVTSVDGKTWREAPLPVPPGSWPNGLACGHGRCIVGIRPLDEERPSPTQAFLESSDAVHWTEVAVDAPYVDPDSQLSYLQVTRAGFIATTGLASPVWLSGDGVTWRSVDVLPPGSPDSFHAFAVGGDVVVGTVEGESVVPDAFWQGSLAAMAAAP